MILAGIPDPLRQLPDMAAILDVTEILITEHMSPEKLEDFNRKLYRPEPGTTRRAGTDPEATPDPVGFEVDEQQDSFAAFAKLASGLE